MTQTQRSIVIGSACIFGGLLLLLVLWAYSEGHKKESEIIGNIGFANGQNAVIANQVKNAEVEVNNAEKNSNRAVNALRDSVNKPSSQFDGNRANDRYCRDFPNDCQ